MKFALPCVAVLVSCLALSPASASEGQFRVGVTGGTLGVGPEIAYRLNSRVGVRANATFLSFGHSVHSGDVDYDGHARLGSGGAMIDLFPFKGGFRLSAGARVNGNRVDVTGKPMNASYVINGTRYSLGEIGTLSTDTALKSVAPMATIGWAGRMHRGFTFGVEAGALFQGTAHINPLRYTGLLADTNDRRAMMLRRDIEAERTRVQNDINDYKVYPVLQFSIGYRF